MALKGRSALAKVSTNDTTYYTVAEIKEKGISLNGENLDITSLGDSWKKRMQGLKDGSWDISGFYSPADTNGQVAIRSALINDTTLYMQILPDGMAGFKQEIKVSKFEVKAAVGGIVEVSISAEGTGAVTII